ECYGVADGLGVGTTGGLPRGSRYPVPNVPSDSLKYTRRVTGAGSLAATSESDPLAPFTPGPATDARSETVTPLATKVVGGRASLVFRVALAVHVVVAAL